jgi:hypothetical protein
MGPLTAEAQAKVAALRAAGVSASIDVRKLNLPGVLVVPVPSLTFDILDGQSVEATFKAWAITNGPGDLAAAEKLEELVLKTNEVLDVESAEPGAYSLPGSSDPLPAVELTLTTDVVDVTT